MTEFHYENVPFLGSGKVDECLVKEAMFLARSTDPKGYHFRSLGYHTVFLICLRLQLDSGSNSDEIDELMGRILDRFDDLIYSVNVVFSACDPIYYECPIEVLKL